MLKIPYLILKNRLSGVTGLKHTDWDLQQDAQIGETHIKITPMALISFLPVKFTSETQRLQRAVLTFRIRLVSLTRFADERDMTDEVYINHMGIEQEIYRTLHGKSFQLSLGVSVGPGDPDPIVLSNIRRTDYQPHNQVTNLISTYQEFAVDFCDVTAMKTYQAVEADIEVDYDIVDSIEIDA